MLDFFDSITFGFRAVIKWNMMRTVLISGLLVSAVWILAGIFLWNPLVSLVSFMLELVPFFMVRSNGAQIISMFIWVQVVFITFAIIVAFFGTLFSKQIEKYKHNYFYMITLTCSAVFWTIIWFFKSDYLHIQFVRLLNLLPFETVDKSMAYLISCLMIYNLMIISMLFIASILSDKVLSSINKEYFDDEVIYKREFKIIKYTIKDTFIFCIASIVLFPLFFVPIANWIVQVGLWTNLARNTFKYDASSVLFENVDEEKLQKNNKAIWTISFMASLFNFIPLLNAFGPFFGEISIFHYLKTIKE